MLLGYGGDDGYHGRHHIGGIEASPHADLQDRHVDALLSKIHQSRTREQFEMRGRGGQFSRPEQPLDLRAQPGQNPAEGLGRDGIFSDTDPLFVADQMGRGVQPGLVPVQSQDAGQHGAHRSLPIGAGHQDARIAEMGIP